MLRGIRKYSIERAKTIATEGLREAPDQMDLLIALADATAIRGTAEELERVARRLIAKTAPFAKSQGFGHLAQAQTRRGDHAGAEQTLRSAVAIDPDHPEANQMYKDLAGNRELQRLLKRARSMR